MSSLLFPGGCFGELVAARGSTLPSVITFRLRNMHRDRINGALRRIIPQHGEALEHRAILSIAEGQVRVRSLPLEAGRPAHSGALLILYPVVVFVLGTNRLCRRHLNATPENTLAPPSGDVRPGGAAKSGFVLPIRAASTGSLRRSWWSMAVRRMYAI